jgi:hypothetical protein
MIAQQLCLATGSVYCNLSISSDRGVWPVTPPSELDLSDRPSVTCDSPRISYADSNCLWLDQNFRMCCDPPKFLDTNCQSQLGSRSVGPTILYLVTLRLWLWLSVNSFNWSHVAHAVLDTAWHKANFVTGFRV